MMKLLEVEKITFDLPFLLDHVHCFLAENEEGLTLIDTGLHSTEIIKHTANKPINRIILTHSHPDHIGGAVSVQEKTGAKIWMTKKENDACQKLWGDSKIPLQPFYRESGLDEEAVENLCSVKPPIANGPQADHFLREGDRIQFGKYMYRVIETPGHSDGLICLFNEERGVLFSTDHILQGISPNISFRQSGDQNPLGSFLESLSKIKKLEVEWAIPSHGAPFTNVKKRIEELELHHMKRLDEIHEVIKHSMSAATVCQQIFPKYFATNQLRFALGEVLSHLEYLVNQEECQKEFVNGHWIYIRK
ncbi:hypothetical protein JCM9140_495 [Halalkalibacter wakoensis JCM 9140]|uniref:Metallo-beta-lactamase domain-containing protein n=1 Tax=Halalkalibacter wakoensis JCM 9140 TaxID=1236970 RepID=W4PXU5_9BACI|nr:MBL fold metallo-hydrolase [Halalkalibacter wakoensis]GAE24557.1 hypothetical protein JCM9140_495 [Halalkalibacter wakoensis JCM 9140]